MKDYKKRLTVNANDFDTIVIDDALGEEYYCPYCTRNIRKANGVFVHLDVPHPDDFNSEDYEVKQ